MKLRIIKQTSNLAKNFREIRSKQKLSKSSLVIMTGLDYHTIVKIENGATPDPRIGTVKKLARALDVSVDELIR